MQAHVVRTIDGIPRGARYPTPVQPGASLTYVPLNTMQQMWQAGRPAQQQELLRQLAVEQRRRAARRDAIRRRLHPIARRR